MSGPELIFAAVVLLVGIPAAVKNPTAAALVIVWGIVTALWYLVPGGQQLMSDRIAEVTILFGLDVLVLTVIFAKPPVRDCLPYRNFPHQLQCFFLEKSLWDRVVIGLFAPVWFSYAFLTDGRWWALYFLALAQLLAAVAEPFEEYRRAAKARPAPDTPSSGAQFGVWAGYRGYG